MTRLATMLFAGTLSALPAAADVNIHIGIPAPPPIVVPAPPRLVVVPTTPAVRYAPDLAYNYFAYGGRYYTFHGGSWFVASAYAGPWTYIEHVHVPRPIRIVPARYYHDHPRYVRYKGHPHGMPPGQAKKLYGHKHHHKHRH
jgi:hypothetical protein